MPSPPDPRPESRAPADECLPLHPPAAHAGAGALAALTALAHADVVPPAASAPIAPPLFQTAAFAADAPDTFATLATTPLETGFYTRYGNPTTRAFEEAVAHLEGAEAALATASGMGAIAAALLTFVGRGEHVVAQRALYGGTLGLLRTLAPRLGIEVTFVDQGDPAAFADALRATTRLVLLETPSNPLLRLTDLAAVAAVARAAGVTTLADNTLASPVNQRPLALGVDLVVHSATKYLAGHGDVTAGVLAGPADSMRRVWDTACLLGATLDPFAAWLALRGLRTLPMRVARHNETTLAVAQRLAAHPRVAAVHYPGLPTHPDHALAARQMQGFGGVLSFEVAGGAVPPADAAARVLAGMRLARPSASFGTFATLAVHPAAMWAGMVTPAQLAEAGLPPGLIRLAVGFEAPDEIVRDLDAALATLDGGGAGAP